MIPDAWRLLKQTGTLIVSGIIEEKKQMVLKKRYDRTRIHRGSNFPTKRLVCNYFEKTRGGIDAAIFFERIV